METFAIQSADLARLSSIFRHFVQGRSMRSRWRQAPHRCPQLPHSIRIDRTDISHGAPSNTRFAPALFHRRCWTCIYAHCTAGVLIPYRGHTHPATISRRLQHLARFHRDCTRVKITDHHDIMLRQHRQRRRVDIRDRGRQRHQMTSYDINRITYHHTTSPQRNDDKRPP